MNIFFTKSFRFFTKKRKLRKIEDSLIKKINMTDIKNLLNSFRNNFYFISDEKLFTILNFDFDSFRFLGYAELVDSLDRGVPKHRNPSFTSSYDELFYNHVKKIYIRNVIGYTFSQESHLYSFIFGFYLFLIWKLGGGRRFAPLISTYNKSNYYGFYDLHFTPLAFVFSIGPLLRWKRGTPSDFSINLRHFKFYNVNNVRLGPIITTDRDQTLSEIRKSWLSGSLSYRAEYFRFAVFLVLCRLISLPFICFFHLFGRPLFFWLYVSFFYFSGNFRITRRAISLPYDYFWKKMYFRYFAEARRIIAIDEGGLSPQEFESRESDFVGFSYGDIRLTNERIFSLLIFRQGIHMWRGYHPDSLSSFFSGYYVTSILARPLVQHSILKSVNSSRVSSYKRSVLQHALSIAPASLYSKKGYGRLRFEFVISPHNVNVDIDFFRFVRQFTAHVRLTLSLVKTKKFSPLFTPFYITLKRRSRFIQLFNFKFYSILSEQVFAIFSIFKGVFFFPFNFFLIWLSGDYFYSNSSRDHLVKRSRLFSTYAFKFFFPARLLCSFFVSIFELIKLYFYLFFEYFLAVLRQFYNLIKKAFFFESYYNYYYFFRRYFFTFLFTRFFSREIEDELDQMKDISDLINDDIDEDFGPLDFEFQDYEIGFEQSNYYDDYTEFGLDSYSDKSFSSFQSSAFDLDSRVFNNSFFEQIFWGWISINYGELSSFLFRQQGDLDRFKSIDTSLSSLDDSLFEDAPLVTNYGLDDEMYSTEDEQLEDDDYEEFYYDPEFIESFERYYEYLLTDKTLVELNNKLLSYRLKLNKWHSGISKKLIPIPKEFLLMPSNLRQPTTPDDWKVLTLVVSTLVLNESQDRAFAGRNNVEFINDVWSKFSASVKKSPDKIFHQLDSPDFEKRYEIIEQKFSSLYCSEGFIHRFIAKIFGSEIANRFRVVFSVIRRDFRATASALTAGRLKRTDFSLLDTIYSSFIAVNSGSDFMNLDDFKGEFSNISHLDVLSIIFYLRFLADSDFPSFYKFIDTAEGRFIWSKFENAFNIAVKYSPQTYDFATFEPFTTDLRSYLNIEHLLSAYVESANASAYSKDNFTFEGLFAYPVRGIYALFNIPYSGLLASGPAPRPGHPANVFGAGFDDEESWNLITETSMTGPTSNNNIVSAIFFDPVYEYFVDPTVALTLFPFSYIDFMEDTFEIDEMDAALDIDDQYMLSETEFASLDSMAFYVNEDDINDDAMDELDTFDPTSNDDDFGYITDPEAFDTDDTEVSGDLPYYDGDLELWIDDNLEGGEDWEPEELDSVEDVSLPINRLFFGTLSSSSLAFPATDYRLYTGMFSGKKHSETGYDLNYDVNLKIAYSVKSTKALVNSIDSLHSIPNLRDSGIKDISFFFTSIKFLFAHLIRFYFYAVAFFFNVTFYTYANDVSHIKKALIFKHFSKNSSGYRVPLIFVDRLKSWLYGYEDFYENKDSYERFKADTFNYGDFYQEPQSGKFDFSFFNFRHYIPFSDFLFEEGRDAEYEMTDFLVHSQQDYLDFDNLNYKGLLDMYDNSRFSELDELELFHMDDLEESAPLNELFNEEHDWDIGAAYSYSADDFVRDTQMFNDRVSIFISAVSSAGSLISDYYFYFIKAKFNVYVLNPFYYWNMRATYEWTRLAATYGLSVYFFRYIFSLALIFSLAIYSYFVFPRIFYWFFVNSIDYGLFLFANATFTFLVFFLAWLFFFPHFSSFYTSFSRDEKLSFYSIVVIIWVFYVFGGYARFPWLPVFLDREIFQNLGTEPGLGPEALSREYLGDSTNLNLESDRSIIFYDMKGDRELVYDYDKYSGDYNRRVLAFTFDYKRLTWGVFADSFKADVLGIRNAYFTGYKYIHTNYDFLFSRHLIDAYHGFVHRHYNYSSLGGLPKRYARVIKRHALAQFSRIRALKVAYAYSTALASNDEAQSIDPANYLVEDSFANITENAPDYPYDFRSDSYYSLPQNDEFYSELFVPKYGSSLKISRMLKSYNLNYVTPRKKVIFYKGRKFSRYYNTEGHGRRRRISNYIYRYGRVGQFKHRQRTHLSYLSKSNNHVFSYFYGRVLKHRYSQTRVKRGQFASRYSENFEKFILFQNFPRAKAYIDMFTFRPSQLFPRPTSKNLGHTRSFYYYYSAVNNIRNEDAYIDSDLIVRPVDEVKDLIDEEGFFGNWMYYSKANARLRHMAKSKTFYRAHVSRLAQGKNFSKFYRPFFNFARYAQFVHAYNEYIITIYPRVRDNYYVALSTFVDKYLISSFVSTNYKAYLSGLGTYQTKFERSPLTQSKFSRDPKRFIRKKYRRHKKDLFVYPAKRFAKLKTPVDIFYSNYSYKLKRYSRRPLARSATLSRNRALTRANRNLHNRKNHFFNKFYYFRHRYKRFFSVSRRYRTRIKRFYSRRRKRRFLSKNFSFIRNQNIFNQTDLYRDKWLYGLRSFNKTVAAESKAMRNVREHELKFKTSLRKLGDKIPHTAVTNRLDIKGYTLPVDFLLDNANFHKPKFSYYRYSPINYAFNSQQFKLLRSDDKAPQSLFQFWGFDRDDTFEHNQDIKIMLEAVVTIQDFNRSRLFRAKRHFFKPYFYKYLQFSANKKYKSSHLFEDLKEKFTEEFILENLLPPVDTDPIYPKPNKKFTIYHSILKVRDSKNPENIKTFKRLKKVVPPKNSKAVQAQLRYEHLYKKRYARLMYNWQKKSRPHVKREFLKNTIDYERTRGRYEIVDYEDYVRKHRPRRSLLYFENRIFGPTFNERLAEAETFVTKEKRRKKAALRRLRQKRKKELKLARARARRKRLQRKRVGTPFGSPSSSPAGADSPADFSNFEEAFRNNPFFDNNDPTRFF